MKKLLLKTLLFTLSFAFVSCQKNDDNNTSADNIEESNFGTEKYEDISGLYKVESDNVGIRSIELTAGGEYIVLFTSSYYDNNITTRNSEIQQSIFAPAKVNTRAVVIGDNYVAGTFSYDEEEKEIILEDYGTLLINRLNADGTFSALVLSTENGTRVELDVTKQEEMENSVMTNNLCRTWIPKSNETIIKIDSEEMRNQTVLHVKYTYETEELSIMKMEESQEFTEEEIEDFIISTLKKVVFSKAGTYVVYHEYEANKEVVGLSNWRWNDEEAGYLLYYWDGNQDYDFYMEGIAKISFAGETMTIVETIEDVEEYDDEYDTDEEYGLATITLTNKTILIAAN